MFLRCSKSFLFLRLFDKLLHLLIILSNLFRAFSPNTVSQMLGVFFSSVLQMVHVSLSSKQWYVPNISFYWIFPHFYVNISRYKHIFLGLKCTFNLVYSTYYFSSVLRLSSVILLPRYLYSFLVLVG